MADEQPDVHDDELRLEASTMALYVAVVLLATVTLVAEREFEHQPRVLAVVWGTSIGLALAHIFAFTVASARIASHTPEHRVRIIGAQLAGAALVAIVASVPVLFLPASAEMDADRVVLASFIGLVGYRVSRDGGRSRVQSLVVAGLVLAVGIAVAIVKNTLATH